MGFYSNKKASTLTGLPSWDNLGLVAQGQDGVHESLQFLAGIDGHHEVFVFQNSARVTGLDIAFCLRACSEFISQSISW